MLCNKELPPSPPPTNRQIVHRHGVNVDANTPPARKQAPRNHALKPNLAQLIERSESENASLRQELQSQLKKEGASIYFLEEVRHLAEKLLQAANIYEDLRIDINDEELGKQERGVVDKRGVSPRGTARGA